MTFKSPGILLKVMADGDGVGGEAAAVGVLASGGGGGPSGVGGVDGGLVAGRQAPVPAAVALLLLDAGVVPGLVAGVAEVGQHVRP